MSHDVIILLILLAFFAVASWLAVMVLWWRTEAELAPVHIAKEILLREALRISRFSRRGWYAGTMYSKQALRWSGKRAEHAFVTLFPKAAPAFTKRDLMTGLEHGPSSYFLHSITTPSIANSDRAKQARRKRKIV